MLHSILTLLDWVKTHISLQFKQTRPLFNEGDLWWSIVGMNVGVEMFGKGKNFVRPVLILKKFNTNSFLAVPLTTQTKEGPWRVAVVHGGKQRFAVFSQIRTLDSKRLINKIGTLTEAHFAEVKGSFIKMYTAPENLHPADSGAEAGIGG